MTKEKKREYMRQYYAANREKRLEYYKEYQNTPMGRALHLLSAYNRLDKKYNRGEGDLTAKWIVDNIFSKQCVHCGESDWRKIGCNRIDNSKPHTMDNVEPCCKECNDRLAGKEQKQVYQYTLNGELVMVWEGVGEAGRNGFNQGNVSQCCHGKRYKYKGYKWSFNPL